MIKASIVSLKLVLVVPQINQERAKIFRKHASKSINPCVVVMTKITEMIVKPLLRRLRLTKLELVKIMPAEN